MKTKTNNGVTPVKKIRNTGGKPQTAIEPQERKSVGRTKQTFADFINKVGVREDVICRMYGIGLPIGRICEILGITESSWAIMMRENPEFARKFKNAGMIDNMKLVQALFKIATGYKVKETKVAYDKETGTFATTEIEKVIAPDLGALKFWLINRMPDQWKSDNAASVQDNSINQFQILLQQIDGSKISFAGFDEIAKDAGS